MISKIFRLRIRTLKCGRYKIMRGLMIRTHTKRLNLKLPCPWKASEKEENQSYYQHWAHLGGNRVTKSRTSLEKITRSPRSGHSAREGESVLERVFDLHLIRCTKALHKPPRPIIRIHLVCYDFMAGAYKQVDTSQIKILGHIPEKQRFSSPKISYDRARMLQFDSFDVRFAWRDGASILHFAFFKKTDTGYVIR